MVKGGFMEVVSREIEYCFSTNMIEQESVDVMALAENGVQEAIADSEGVVREMCDHIAQSGGKRIRPQLVVYSGLTISRINNRMICAAVAAELIHMASLVHDDIIDVSDLRRGKPSVNKQWGNHAAVLCGDWLFAKAFGILSGKGLADSMVYMVDAIQSMCHGELIQASNKNYIDISLDAYYEQIVKKTAKLLECCCKSGAVAGCAKSPEIKALGEFGLNIGKAFQIIDDVLDFRGNTGKMGKPKGEDLRQGIITLPVILLMQDKEFGGQARELISMGNCRAKDVAAINSMLIASGAMEKAYGVADSFINLAQSHLVGLPDSKSKVYLNNLASSLRRREN
jgi:heptaprenyl diphosphate synthase